MTTVEDRLREATASLDATRDPIPPFRRVRQRARRRRMLAFAGAFVVLVGVGTSIAVTRGTTQAKVFVANPGTTPGSLGPQATTTSAVATPDLAVVTRSLTAYVESESAAESAAGKGAAANVWGEPVLSEHSPPVLVGDTYFAVAAFSFDPRGHPVQVLSYADAKWSVVSALAAPTAPGTISHAGALDLIAEEAPVEVGYLAGPGRPSFVIDLAGGGCFGAALVAPAPVGPGWAYVPFAGPFPTSDVLGGDPRLVTDSTMASLNDCTAVPLPVSRRLTWTWAYDAASGNMIGHQHAGWLAATIGVAKHP